MKLFHTFTGIILVVLACNTKTEEKKAENWEHFVENTNEKISTETTKTNTMEQGSIHTFKVNDLTGNEEKATDEALTRIAESAVNQEAESA